VTPSSDGFRIITISRANCGRMAGTVAEEPHHHQSEAAGCVPSLVHARKAKLMMGMINKTDKGMPAAPTFCSIPAPCPRVGFPAGSCRGCERCSCRNAPA